MPPSRRVSSGPTAASRGKAKTNQKTLPFNNKITKPSIKTAPGKGIASPQSKKIIVDSVQQVELPTPEPTSEPVAAEGWQPWNEVEPEQKEDKQPEEEERALKLTKRQLDAYWKAKSSLRKAPRVHQEGLDVEEKILREFDMDGRFGSAVGITRLARWRRAQRLKLNPPIEALSILLKDEKKGITQYQVAYMDRLLGGHDA